LNELRRNIFFNVELENKAPLYPRIYSKIYKYMQVKITDLIDKFSILSEQKEADSLHKAT